MVTWRVGQLRIDVVGGDAVIQPEETGGPHPPTPSPAMQEKGSRTESVRSVAWPGEELREFVRFDERGRYRPLSGAKTLPGGWRVQCDAREVDAVVDMVYPLATVHTREWMSGDLRVVSLEDVLVRQTGRYAVAAELDDDGRVTARAVLCGDCVRTPVWAGEEPDTDEIPCPEPCSVMVALCREAALWQREPPPCATVDETVAYAAFEREGNAIRETYLAMRG